MTILVLIFHIKYMYMVYERMFINFIIFSFEKIYVLILKFLNKKSQVISFSGIFFYR